MLLAHLCSTLVVVLLNSKKVYFFSAENKGGSGEVFVVVKDRAVQCLTVSTFFVLIFALI